MFFFFFALFLTVCALLMTNRVLADIAPSDLNGSQPNSVADVPGAPNNNTDKINCYEYTAADSYVMGNRFSSHNAYILAKESMINSTAGAYVLVPLENCANRTFINL